LRDPAHHFYLTEAEMGVHNSQSDREVPVGLRFDERHLMLVPSDSDRLLDRQPCSGQHRETFAQAERSPTAHRMTGHATHQHRQSDRMTKHAAHSLPPSSLHYFAPT
jgi:hypothetical protein